MVDHETEKFKKLECHLNILVEKLNTDLNFLSAWELSEKICYQEKIKNVMRRICLLDKAKNLDVSFLHEDFHESLLEYENDVESDFNAEEIKELSLELVEQLKPEEFKFE